MQLVSSTSLIFVWEAVERGIQHFAYAGHHPRSMYGPMHVPEGP